MTRLLILALLLVVALPALAEDSIGEQLSTIDARIEGLVARIDASPTQANRIYNLRRERLERQRSRVLHDHADQVIESGAAPDPELLELLSEEPARALDILGRLNSQLELPKGEETAAQLAKIDANLSAALDSQGFWHAILLQNLATLQALGVETQNQERQLRRALEERTENISAYLSLTMTDVEALQRRAASLPDDQDLQALYAVTARLVTTITDELRSAIGEMDAYGIDTTDYRSQLIAATGSISKDLFSADVVASLVGRWLETLRAWFEDNGVQMVLNLILFIGLMLIARTLSRAVRRATQTAFRISHTPISRLLQSMIITVAASSVYVIGMLIALAQVGISLGPLLAGLGIAGFILGFALQDTLSNFASGLMILFYQPFDVGDVIETEGISGKVHNMSLVNTTIMTFDNQTLIIPNTKIWGNVIKNVTAQTRRRVDFVFGVAYDSDIALVEDVLRRVADEDDRILDEPETIIRLHELGDSSVNFVLRPWVKTEDYWDVYWDTMRTVKLRFDEAGIEIPFPQRDVHIVDAATTTP